MDYCDNSSLYRSDHLAKQRKEFRMEVNSDHFLLKEWCENNWVSLISRPVSKGNIPKYHSCCNSFSRRSAPSAHTHPTSCTSSVLSIRPLRNLQSGQDLYCWLINQYSELGKTGNKQFLPMINIPHQSQLPSTFENAKSWLFSLMETNRAMVSEVSSLEKQIEELKNQNKQLLLSSQNWFLLLNNNQSKACHNNEISDDPLRSPNLSYKEFSIESLNEGYN